MQTNTMPTLLQAIRQDPDTGLRWAMRDYAALGAGHCPPHPARARPGYRGMYRRCICGAVAQCLRLEATGTPVAGLAHRHRRNTAINRYRALQRHDTLPLTDELAATIADLPADPAGDAADELAVLVAALEPPTARYFCANTT